jgi:NAD(P)-dependent dehydrogenase (short-subunit alcohol dehydrogenase family)
MSSKGAKNIVLVSRRAAIEDKVRALIDTLTPLGVRIVVKACDVTSQESVEALVNEEMKDLPPIRGVIHGAMVLRVSFLLQGPIYITIFRLLTQLRTCSSKTCLSKTSQP